MLRLVTLALALAAVPAAAAQTCSTVWTNPAGGDWNTAANWSGLAVPGPADDACVTLVGTYTVTTSSAITVNSLTVGAATGTQTLQLTRDLMAAAGGIVGTNGVLNHQVGFLLGGDVFQVDGELLLDGINFNTRGVSGAGTELHTEGTVTWTREEFVLDQGGVWRHGGTMTAPLVATADVVNGGVPLGLFEVTGSIEAGGTSPLVIRAPTRFDGAELSATATGTLNVFSNDVTWAGTTTGTPAGVVRMDSGGGAMTAEPGAAWDLGGEGLSWVSGFLTSGTLANTGLAVLDGINFNSRGVAGAAAIFQNDGTVLWEREEFILADGGQLVNAGAIDAQLVAAANLNNGATPGLFTSTGSVSVASVNPLTIRAAARFDGAALSAEAGASLRIWSVDQTWAGTTTGAPAGTVTIDPGGTGSLVAEAGAAWDLGGEGLSWVSGFLTSGTLTNTGLLVLDGINFNSRGIDAATLANTGTLLWEREEFRLGNGGTIENSGTLRTGLGTTLKSLDDAGGAGGLVNTGLVSAENLTLDVNVPFDHQTGGVIGGTATLDLTGATLTHDGDTAPGTSPGQLNWNGADWAPSAGSTLFIEIGGATAGADYDQLAIGDAAVLAGTLDLSVAAGAAPTVGDTYTVLTASSVTGTFGTVSGPPGWAFSVTYNPTNVVVTVTAVGVTAVLTGDEGWRMLAPSVAGQTLDGVVGGLWTQGFQGADVETGGANVLFYVESTPGPQNDGYVPPGDQSDAFALGTGAFVYVFEDDDQGGPQPPGFPKTIVQSGTDATGAQPIPVSYSDSGSPADDGWTLAGNPFAASLDWTDAAWMRTNMSSVVYVWNPNTADYLTHNTVMGSIPGGLVAPGQGMWVQATGTAPALTAPASARTVGGTFVGRTGADGMVELRLDDAARSVAASAFVGFDARAADGADALDAYELTPVAPDAVALWTGRASDGTALDLQMLAPADGARLALGVAAWAGGEPAASDLVLRWPALPDGWAAELHDAATGETVDMTQATEYAFTASAGSARVADGAALSVQAPPGERFTLSLGSAVLVADEAEPAFRTRLLAPRPNPTSGAARIAYTLAEAGPVRLSVIDLLGREVAVLADGDHAEGAHEARADVRGLAAGVYVVRMQTGEAVTAQRFTVVR